MLEKKIKDGIEILNEESCAEAKVLNIFNDICFEFCIEQFSIAVFAGKEDITESFYIYDTYSKEWIERYRNQQYYLYDPVFSSLQKVAIPFEWDTESFQNILPAQKNVMREARDFGICSGITISLIPHRTFHGFVTVLNKPFLHYDVLSTLSLIGNISVNKIISEKNKKTD